MIKKHKILFGIVILAIATGGYFYINSGKTTTTITTYTYGTAEKGMIAQSVSGSGQVSVENQVDVKTKAAGDVIAVNVVEGQEVAAGEVLAKIDSTDAQKTVRDAQSSLESTKLSLSKLKQDNSLSLTQSQNILTQAKETLQNSQDSLKSDYSKGFNSVVGAFSDLPVIMAGLNDIVTGSNSYVVQSSPTYLDYYYDMVKIYDGKALGFKNDAFDKYRAAKAKYDENFQSYKATSSASSEETIEELINETYETVKSIADAIKSVNTAVQRYEDDLKGRDLTPQTFADNQITNLNGYMSKANSHLSSLLSSTESIKSDKESIASNQRTIDEKTQSLQNLTDTSNPLSIQTQELAVSQKENALADAQEALENYTIKAPFDGIIAAVDAKKSDSVAVNGAIVTIITNQQIANVSLNEVDVANVKAGQKATLTFDAVTDLTITGHVTGVDAIGTVSQGVVSYNVEVAFDTQDSRVKPGMSVTAAIITNSKQDVLLVPSTAVKTSNAGIYVLVPVNPVSGAVSGSTAEGQMVNQQTVTVGISDDTSTEIISGLEEGQTIVIKSTNSKGQTKTTTSQGGSILNMMGGSGPAGDAPNMRIYSK